jgi:phosphoribosylanthranilate isomerase
MVRVKICGITNLEDALAAVELGADALGFVFFHGSPRSITPDKAAEIVSALPPFVTTVGVFVNEEPSKVTETMGRAGISVLQLHGDELPDQCTIWPRVIKAFRVRDFPDLRPLEHYRTAAFLLDAYSPDAYGGTGQVFNWDIALEAQRFGRIILSGGLTAENVGGAVARVLPYAVDVSSGVERDKGRKDREKMNRFIQAAKAASTKPGSPSSRFPSD